MEKTEAVEIASKYAKERGYEISLYDITPEKIEKGWEIYYQRKSENFKPRPGDFFTVFVDNTSKTVQKFIEGK